MALPRERPERIVRRDPPEVRVDRTQTACVIRTQKKPNAMTGELETLEFKGEELATFLDIDGREYCFMDAKLMNDTHTAVADNRKMPRGARPMGPPIDFTLQQLCDHFVIPEVPDVATVHPEKFQASMAELLAIQTAINQLCGIPDPVQPAREVEPWPLEIESEESSEQSEESPLWSAPAERSGDGALNGTDAVEPSKACVPTESGAALFDLGHTVTTPGVLDAVPLDEMLRAMHRHHHGDWGTLSTGDLRANDRAVKTGERIFSAYDCGETKFWIITEADRSVTTVLLPSEY